MRKYVFILLIFFSLTSLLIAEPYKPYPILWIHGLGSSPLTWGAKIDTLSNGFKTDSIIGFGDSPTYQYFLNYMLPIVQAWHEYEVSQGLTWTYTTPEMDAYPNKTFLEVINMDDPWGSIDPDAENYPPPYLGQGDELVHRIIEVLEEYYGDDWASDPDAQVILISHSLGGLATREALKERPDLIPHIAKVITANSPHLGSLWATPFYRDLWIMVLGNWHPIILPIEWLLGKAIRKINNIVGGWLGSEGGLFSVEGMIPKIFR